MNQIMIIAFTLSLASCKKKDMMQEGPVQMIDQKQTLAADTVGRGTFTGFEHGLSGNVLLYKQKDGVLIVRLTQFNMTPGPDVYVYLSKTSTYSSSAVLPVTKLTTGYTNSNINLPAGTSYDKTYRYILVYCVQYSSLFGYAELQ